MTEATTRFYFDTPAQRVDTGSEELPCRRFGTGTPLLLVHEEKPAEVARAALEFLGPANARQ
jgi:hypothetical protein